MLSHSRLVFAGRSGDAVVRETDAMLARFFSWWTARIAELLPKSWTDAGVGAPDGIVADLDRMNNLTLSIRGRGKHESVTSGAAARLANRKPVFLRAPPDIVLEKHHVVPAAPRRDLDLLLRYELARITPFTSDTLFWRWDGHPKPGDRSRIAVTLTMVPKAAMAARLETLAKAGIEPRFIETGPAERTRLLAIDNDAGDRAGRLPIRALAWACACLAVVALALPVVLQGLALHATNTAIDDLQPAIKRVEAMRRGITADGAGQAVLAREMERTGDVLQALATVTRILPDDTYLTDFSLRDRQMVLGGRSAAAARLITGLSADQAIRDAAFAAPVTRIEGATTDVFSIRASIAAPPPKPD
ncbi:PilN domain-containing protein [Rhodopila sp.]|uniref:PilN domain-containing protein n=1 Tax=Rhodopila sp. TaxID=2480087 RepID=UPI003D0B9C2D